MAKITIVLPRNKKKLMKLLNDLDNRYEYEGDNCKSYWLEFDQPVEEINLDTYESRPELSISIGSNDRPSTFVRIPFDEMLYHFDRLNFFGCLKQVLDDQVDKMKNMNSLFVKIRDKLNELI